MKRLLTALVLLSMAGPVLFSKVKVACIGDSVTYGYGIEDRESNSYPAQLSSLLGSLYEVRNFGHNGATLLRRGHRPYNGLPEYAQALEFRPDIAVIHLGLNDTDPRDWPNWAEDFIPDYRALIDDFRRVNPDVKIWICKLSPIFHGHFRFLSGTRDWHTEIQKRIELIGATSGAGMIDLYSPLVTRPDLFADNLHPDTEGAGIIAKTVYGALTGDYGGLQLSPTYADGMVLQRGKTLTLGGIANAGANVDVALTEAAGGKRGKVARETVIAAGTAVAAADGKWSVTLPALDAGGPYVLKVANRCFKDVWVGEVWICAGQSNMEFRLKNCYSAAEDLSEASVRKDLHLLQMRTRWFTDDSEWSVEALSEVNALRYFSCSDWKVGDAAAAAEFSAVGYHFGKKLADSLGCHVGLVNCSVGGSTTESWCNREVLQWEFPQVLYDWYHGDFGQEWARGRALKNIALSPAPQLQRHPYETGYLFDAAIRLMDRYPCRGILWYQGESNSHNVEIHAKLFAIAVESWRNYWGEPLHVETIQLSGMDRPSWPRFRDSQRILAATIPGVGMTVCSDLGDRTDVHPRAKKPVGERAALSALYNVYGNRQVTPSGPSYKGFERDGNNLVLSFDWADGMTVSGGFEVAGKDGIYHPAKASVQGETVVVSSPVVEAPVCVRYAWKPYPDDADLKNGAGLPASSFCDEHLLRIQ